MAGAIDEDTARTIASGRETAGAVISSAQSDLKKVFLVFVGVLLVTIWALHSFVWDKLKEDLLRSRLSDEVLEEVSVVVVTPFDVILLQVKIGIIVGIIFAAPTLLYFGRDALKARGWWPSQRIPRWKVWVIAVLIVLLSVAGVFYSYVLFFPLMFEFLASNAVNSGFTPTYSIVKWTEFIVFLMISFALAAQLPLAMSSTAASGIIRYETFRDKWRYAVLGIFVFGAVFSPPDPFTQVMWALPLIALYWFSLGVTKLVVLTQRAGDQVPISDVLRDRWNLLAGTLVLAGGASYLGLTRGGLAAFNDLLEWIGSSYRLPTASELGAFGLAPEAVAGILAAVVGLFAGLVAFFYFRIEALEELATTDPMTASSAAGGGATAAATGDAATTADATAPSAGEPAEIDIDALSASAVRAAPLEAFAGLSEEEALAHAQRAMEDDDPEKAQLILDRFDEAEAADVEAPSADETADADDGNVVTSTAAGMMDAFTEDETEEEDIGGYYYDIAFILDSLTSKAMWLVGTFMLVMAATFVYLYSGGIDSIRKAFVSEMPATLQPQVDIVTLHPVEALIFEIKFSTLLGLVATIPLILYFAWPAIEKRGIATGDRRTMIVWGGSLLVALVGGSLLGFFYISPAIISWLATDALTSHMVIAYRVNNFGWLVIFTTVGIGLLVEIPVTMFLFHLGGIVSYGTMRRRWRVVVLAMFALAGFFSPKGLFTMFLLALPASFAFGVGLGLLWLYTRVTGTPARLRGDVAD